MWKKKIFKKGVACLLSAAMVLTSVGVMPWIAGKESASAAETADITTGLVAYYPFDESLDNIVTNGKATLHGGAGDNTWNTAAVGDATYATGKKGKAFDFQGGANNVSGNNGLQLDAMVTGDAYTISFWAQMDSYNSYSSLLFAGELQKGFNIAENWGNSDAFPTIRVWNADGWGIDGAEDVYVDAWSSPEAGKGIWAYITVTYADGVLTLYRDGVMAQQNSNAAHTLARIKDYTLFLGINFWDATIDGRIDDFALYDRALSADEVTALYTEENTDTFEITSENTTLTNKIDSAGNCTVGSLQLSAPEFPKKPEWKVSDGAHATVDAHGKVTLTKEAADGEKITVTAKNFYGVTDTIELTVEVQETTEDATPDTDKTPTPTEPPTPTPIPAGVTLSKTIANLEVGGTVTLTASVTPNDTGVNWTSSNTAVATVDANGKVTAVKAGVATITAASKDNAKLTATCQVIVSAVVDTNLTDESQLGTSDAVKVYDRVSVHDPSIVVGYYEGTYSATTKVYAVQNAAKTRKKIYFVFGSHMAWAYSFDLKNWKTFTNNINTNYNTIFKTDGEWSAHGSADESKYDLSGNLWAPDIIWNPTLNKWCMYMSVNGDNWFTSVVLLTSDSLNGSWERVGPVVYSGFSNKATDEWVKNQTDLFTVVGGTTIPARYKENRNGNLTYGMNAIDPCVVFDDDGSLWMAYGSWFGGIYMLKLDAGTGLRDYTQTYETKDNVSDAYQGLKLAGGGHASGEAPYIQKINGKYYLFLSYGALEAAGGYNMRVFSADAITGPYKDLSGEDARKGDKNTDTASENAGKCDKTVGSQLMNYYRWGFMDTGFAAEGHNSAFVDDDGKAYVVYHTRFDDGTEGHQVRVHQLFTAKNNGLVAAPFEYAGETLSDTAYDTSKVVGNYNVILQQPTNYGMLECNTDKIMELKADGTVTGAYTGTWEQAADGPYVKITLGSDVYQGVFLIQRMEEKGSNAMCFTAVGDNDLALWGYKMEDQTVAISETIAMLDGVIPASTAVDVALPTEGVHGATVSWKSNGIVMEDDGTVNPLKTDTSVVVTATVTSGKYTFSKDYTIKVLGTDTVKTDTEVELKSYYTDAPLDISKLSENSHVTLANPFYKTTADISNGAVISFDVTRKGGEGQYLSNLMSLMGQSGRLFFTGGSYLGYNGPGGFYDANVDNVNWAKAEDLLVTGQSVNIKLKFTSDGFEVYKNGTLAYSMDTLEAGATKGSISPNAGGTRVTLSSRILEFLKDDASDLNFGYGNFWADQIFNGTISNVKFSYVQKAITADSSGSALTGIYSQDYENVADINSEWTSTNAQVNLGFGKDDEHGKYAKFDFTGDGANSRGAHSYFGTNVTTWPNKYQLEFDMSLKAGNGQESQVVVLTSNGSYKSGNENNGIDTGYVFKMTSTNSETWTVNEGSTATIPASTWVHFNLTGTKDSTAAHLTITKADGSKAFDGDVTATDTGAVKGIYLLAGRYQAVYQVDNILIKEQGATYANLSAYNSILARAEKFVSMQEEKPVFTDATINALKAAIATAKSTVTSGLTASDQGTVDGQVTLLTNAVDTLALKGYTVTIGTLANGTVEGLAAGGSYFAGTSLSLTAKPNSGYVFGGWKIGTETVSKNATYSAMVEEDITITPVFTKAADLTEFNKLLAEAEEKIAEQNASPVYTDDTFSVLQQIVVTARVAVSPTLSEENQDIVDAQIEALKMAINGLKRNGQSSNTPEDPDNPDTPSDNPTPTPSQSSGTGSGSSTGAMPPSNTGSTAVPSSAPSPSQSGNPSASPSSVPSGAPGTNPGTVTSAAPGTGGTTGSPSPTPTTSPQNTTKPSGSPAVVKGKVYKSGSMNYKVTSTTSKKKTVTLTKVSNKSVKTYKVGATVKINNQTYKVTAIAPKAFANCKNLKKVTVGKNVKTIGSKAFANCKNLKTVVIGKGVTTINSNAFANCKNLKKITIKSTGLKKVGKNALKGINSNAVIKVPKSKVAKYKKLMSKKGQSSKVKITK